MRDVSGVYARASSARSGLRAIESAYNKSPSLAFPPIFFYARQLARSPYPPRLSYFRTVLLFLFSSFFFF